MERYFQLAGSVVRVTGLDEEMFSDAGVLAEFETECRDWDRQIRCRLVQQLDPPRGDLLFADANRQVYDWEDARITYIGAQPEHQADAYVRAERRGNTVCAQFRREALRGTIPAKAVLKALEAEHLVADNGGFLLHASCIGIHGEAILFTAPCGTGKSTQAALWERFRGAKIINGDRIMVRCTDRGCQAIGIPFSGSSGICRNETLPLKAIVYLGQAQENSITPLKGLRAFRSVLEGCSVYTWDRRDMAACLDAVQQTVAQVPVFHLECTPDERAVQTLEAALRK